MQNSVYIVDGRYYEAACAAFGAGRVLLPSVPCPSLDEPICYHPDMVLCPVESGVCVCAPEMYDHYQKVLSPFGVRLVQGKTQLARAYRGDVAYNVLDTPKAMFSLLEKTDPEICSRMVQQGKQTKRVAQGYARCSSLAFGNAVISADRGLIKAADATGLSVLPIRAGYIRLPGYSYGFIGGASGVLENAVVAFFGDLDLHPDGDAMRRFIRAQGFSVQEVSGMSLTDIGTILRIDLP